MSACDENDPVPCKTPAELAAEETPREKFDDIEARNMWVVWSALVAAVLMIAGGLIRWCVAP